MTTAKPQAIIPKELTELAEKYILQATVRPYAHREDSGHVNLEAKVHPLIYTSFYPLPERQIPLLCFDGSKNESRLTEYSVGIGSDITGGVLLHVRFEDFSDRGRPIIEPLRAEYKRALGMELPNSAPVKGPNAHSNEIFRNVPGSLDQLAEIVFTTMKQHTKPVSLGF